MIIVNCNYHCFFVNTKDSCSVVLASLLVIFLFLLAEELSFTTSSFSGSKGLFKKVLISVNYFNFHRILLNK